ncbi:hypothetical protein [Chondromyces crocatus]|uniref:DUF3618 domain-containing protein n=1 Tax=Chondromyces crocatus TaxID=52 RepID=A0A0K1EDL0_CHOCO|nr:hypothetical protein [Chondromyces crocatus]AKT38648.1 uncharacterized protein CMC5_027960 [Chondromyces crocatus]
MSKQDDRREAATQQAEASSERLGEAVAELGRREEELAEAGRRALVLGKKALNHPLTLPLVGGVVALGLGLLVARAQRRKRSWWSAFR